MKTAMPISGGLSQVTEITRHYWGIDQLRPLQAQAIEAGLTARDSLLVMPTGGGKSLCYQVPPVLAERTDVVISPLIALMKDQVDGLRQCGYPAVALNSGMTQSELKKAQAGIAAGKYRLVFVAPERLLGSYCLRMLREADVSAFAIDEAHCISHWGHDFRPEYRRLAEIREYFPKAGIHAFTATANDRVRDDIVRQLRLREPTILVGDFDRPNLTYRVFPRVDLYAQTLEVVRRHKNEAVIVYCISRKDTEAMAAHLASSGVRAAHYHAGMEPADRRKTQDAFAEERLDVVVATVAFGMGIDRSNVRCVIHAALPKSIEHYQQETGRAGRDGLPSECVLFYSASDVMRWEDLIARSAEEAERPDEVIAAMREQLGHMQRYANAMKCRHQRLVAHFGQEYPRDNCEACDVCLGETEEVADSTVMAQKILSCVARVEERFGANHVAEVLVGANTEMIRSFKHDQLSTYGLLKGMDRKALANLIYQLVDLGVLDRAAGDRPILKLNAASWEVMRGDQSVRLQQPKVEGVKKSRYADDAWSGVDSELFEALRKLRYGIAQGRGVPAFVICGDATLRDLARHRPSSLEGLRGIKGLGDRKVADLGRQLIECITAYCGRAGLSTDEEAPPTPKARPTRSPAREAAFAMFARNESLEDVVMAVRRASSTISGYLAEYIAERRPERVDAWVDNATYQKVAMAVCELGPSPLKPIFEKLDGEIPYETIRIVAVHVDAVGMQAI